MISPFEEIVSSPLLHAKFLNTLSYMENAGARKIAGFERDDNTTLIVLKHASEEFRHAYFLKRQMEKLQISGLENYHPSSLLAPRQTKNYLNRLDVFVCRLLVKTFDDKVATNLGAYLMVTYAIEVRADSLYGAYQDELTRQNSRINVKSIIAEEEGHLAEMIRMLDAFHPDWKTWTETICSFEQQLFDEWISEIQSEVSRCILSKV